MLFCILFSIQLSYIATLHATTSRYMSTYIIHVTCKTFISTYVNLLFKFECNTTSRHCNYAEQKKSKNAHYFSVFYICDLQQETNVVNPFIVLLNMHVVFKRIYIYIYRYRYFVVVLVGMYSYCLNITLKRNCRKTNCNFLLIQKPNMRK